MEITRDTKTGKFHASDSIMIFDDMVSLSSSGISPLQAVMGVIYMIVYFAHENNLHPDLLTPEK